MRVLQIIDKYKNVIIPIYDDIKLAVGKCYRFLILMLAVALLAMTTQPVNARIPPPWHAKIPEGASIVHAPLTLDVGPYKGGTAVTFSVQGENGFSIWYFPQSGDKPVVIRTQAEALPLDYTVRAIFTYAATRASPRRLVVLYSATHNRADSPGIIYDGAVYDVTRNRSNENEALSKRLDGVKTAKSAMQLLK